MVIETAKCLRGAFLCTKMGSAAVSSRPSRTPICHTYQILAGNSVVQRKRGWGGKGCGGDSPFSSDLCIFMRDSHPGTTGAEGSSTQESKRYLADLLVCMSPPRKRRVSSSKTHAASPPSLFGTCSPLAFPVRRTQGTAGM